MSTPLEPLVRRGGPADCRAIGRLLRDFNREFDEPTPGAEWLADRVAQLLAGGQFTVLVVGDGPDGLVVLRFRPSLWTAVLECYVAELYVVPARRGHGLGRALMNAAIEHARSEGADRMDLGTGETDVAARALREPRLQQSRRGRRRAGQLLLRTGALMGLRAPGLGGLRSPARALERIAP